MKKDVTKIDYSKKFLKQLKKTPLGIKSSFRNRLKLYLKDPFHPLLNNHKLTGKFSGSRSINITGDWRAIFAEYIHKNGEKVVIFEVLGTHNQLYK